MEILYMHNKIQSLWKAYTKKPIIVTVHGYGRRCQHEFDNLSLWGEKDGLEIIQFDMYDIFNPNDNVSIDWISRAKQIMDEVLKSNRPIILIGFSMGGVIASYLATLYPIEKLVLLAPAFQFLNKENISNFIAKSFRNDKIVEEIVIPSTFFYTFLEIIKTYRSYISFVNCPILIMHGDVDEVISTKSSKWAYDQINHDRKRLLILHEGDHRLLMNQRVNWEIYQIIKLFINSTIINDTPHENAEDILETYKRELNK